MYFIGESNPGKVKDCANIHGHPHIIMENMGDSHLELTVEHKRKSML